MDAKKSSFDIPAEILRRPVGPCKHEETSEGWFWGTPQDTHKRTQVHSVENISGKVVPA
jgi:hypothetical protein